MPATSAPPKRAEPPWLGGAGAMMAVTITHPIDQTKIRMQTQRVKMGMMATVRQTVANEGFLGLWAGLTGSYVRQATYGVARFGIYRTLNQKAQARQNAKRGDIAGSGATAQSGEAVSSTTATAKLTIPKWTMVMNGAIAGVVAGIVGAPGELIMVRMSADAVRPEDKRYRYRNAIQGLWRIGKTEGLASTFRGARATVLRAVIMNASQLSCYDIIKEQLLSSGYFTDSIPTHLLTAVLGGTISVTLVAPVDFVKSRIQASSTHHPASQLFLQAIKREGPRVMFRGWLPAWWRMAPTTALTFAFYEQLKKIFV